MKSARQSGSNGEDWTLRAKTAEPRVGKKCVNIHERGCCSRGPGPQVSIGLHSSYGFSPPCEM